MSAVIDPLVERVAARHLATTGQPLSGLIRADMLRVQDGVLEVAHALQRLNNQQEHLVDLTRAYLLLLDSGGATSGRMEELAEEVLRALDAVTGAAIRLVPALAAAKLSIRRRPPASLSERVAQRHAAGVLRDLPATEMMLSYTDSGRIFAREVERALQPKLGVLVNLIFQPSLIGNPNTVAWVALSADAEMVTGKLVLHAGVRDDEVVSWGQIVIDGDELEDKRSIAGAVDPVVRLRHVERLVQALLDEIKKNPSIAVVDLISALVQIAGEARTGP